LHRLAQRVRVMAGTHELFAGGVTTIALRELVRQVLASLAVARPPSVDVRVELSDEGFVQLETDQAMTLATVLHELAFNAIVHGLGETGVLEIRAGRNDMGWLVLEVIDDGRGFAVAAGSSAETEAASQRRGGGGGNGFAEKSDHDVDGVAGGAAVIAESSRTGMGLQLVRGLVSRELHGQFNLYPRSDDGGGTRAVVEFPLAAAIEPRHGSAS